MEQFHDASDEILDSEEENFYEESLSKPKTIGSSSMETYDAFGLYGHGYKTVAYEKAGPDFIDLPLFTRWRGEDMKIKDLVMDNVLPFLPAKSLIRFRSTSKQWNHWITSPLLAHRQSYSFQRVSGFFHQSNEGNPKFLSLNNAAYGVPSPSLVFLPALVDIRSSSNGLILCQGCLGSKSYFICNPVNKNFKELPQPVYYHGPQPAIVLAFEPSMLNIASDYQLICAVPLIDLPIVYFELYSSETGLWRCSDTICVVLGDSISFTGNTFYMKGMVYWETSTREVLAFDLETELQGVIPLPCESPPGGVLAQMRGELCYIGVSNCSMNEYSIMIYGGVDLSLKHIIDLHLELNWGTQYRVLPFVQDDVVMIVVGDFMYSYSLSDQRLEVISRAEVGSLGDTRFLPYVNSLVSLA